MAEQCPWGLDCKPVPGASGAWFPWECVTVVNGTETSASGSLAAGICLAGACAEQTVLNVVEELEQVAARLPAWRKLHLGVYASPHDTGGQPSTKYVYDILPLVLGHPRVSGAVIYDGYPAPTAGENCSEPLSSLGCAVAAAFKADDAAGLVR